MVNKVKSAEDFLAEFGRECANWKATYYPTTEEWEKGRSEPWCFNGENYTTFGASDLPAIAGVSNWISRNEFFDIATGKVVREFHGNDATDRGHTAEPHIRELFALEHPDYDVYDGTGIIFRSKRAPWMHASLDGILLHRATGKIGVLEIKHYQYSREWMNGNCPVAIFVQVMGQGYVFDADFGEVCARLIRIDGTSTERILNWDMHDEDVEQQTEAMVADVTEFYKAVRSGKRPQPRLAL